MLHSVYLKAALIASVAWAAAPALAQKTGVGGTGVDENSVVPTCERSLGTIALVEEKTPTDSRLDALPPHLKAMMEMAQMQQGGGGSVDPLPLLKLLISKSRCFTVVDRGAGFEALQRERAIAANANGAASAPTGMVVADYMLTAQVVYSDNKSRDSGGVVGGLFGGVGLRQKVSEAQTLLSLTNVKSGVQEAVASGQARKKDLGIIGGGLTGLGIGALGGTYSSTDMGKITAAALLDGYSKLVIDSRARLVSPAQ